jgi:predicted nucleotidyltransferase
MGELQITIPKNILEAFCIKWKIKTFYFFGSVLRADFDPSKSDLDVMVEFKHDAEWSLLDHVEMRDELVQIAGRSVDLLTKRSIERSQNKIRKEEILSTAKAIYESAA